MSEATLSAEAHLPHYRVRPRFKHLTVLGSQEVTDRIRTALQQPDASCLGRVLDDHYATIMLPAEVQHYWSPQLTLSFEATEEGTLISGLYGPRPAVWTMFVFIYFLIACAAVVITIIGCSNIFLEQSAAILWFVPLLIIVFCSLYLVAYLGQKAGHDQIVELHQFLEKSTGLEIVGD